METKHKNVKGYEMKSFAQVLGYYCCKRKVSNVAGICILLNEYKDAVTITVFLFPYFHNGAYGAQSLMLPPIKNKGNFSLDEEVIALILALSIADDMQLKFTCPEKILNHTDILVYTDEELQKARLEDMEKELEKVRKEAEEARKEAEKMRKSLEEVEKELNTYKVRKVARH